MRGTAASLSVSARVTPPGKFENLDFAPWQFTDFGIETLIELSRASSTIAIWSSRAATMSVASGCWFVTKRPTFMKNLSQLIRLIKRIVPDVASEPLWLKLISRRGTPLVLVNHFDCVSANAV